MAMRATYLHYGQTYLRGLADRVAERDRIEAKERADNDAKLRGDLSPEFGATANSDKTFNTSQKDESRDSGIKPLIAHINLTI